jgi:hypothetical protein
MPASAHSASVTYTQTCYALSLSHSGSGGDPTASPANSTGCTAGNYHSGEAITLTASPDTGWAVGSWTGTSGSSSNTLTMPASAHSASVTYTEIPPDCYVLSLSHTGSGGDPTASPVKSAACTTNGQYVSGEVITLTASPAIGWQVDSWTGTNGPSSNTLTMPASAHAASVTYIESGTQDIALNLGWNLVSFRIHPASTAVADVLASVAGNYDLVYAWDAAIDDWLKADNVPASPDDLLTLDETQGFWIHMTAADTLTVNGTLPITTNIALSSDDGGWNLVGYPSAAGGALPEILTSHGVAAESLELVYAYHAAEADPWKLFDSDGAVYANDLTTLSAGWGYWIQIDTADDTWVVNY